MTLTLLTSCTHVAQPTNAGPLSAVPPDPDAVTVMSLGQQAAQRARQLAPELVLRQVDTDRCTTIFRFTDRTPSQEIMVQIGALGEPPDQWHTTVTTISPLVGRLALGLELQHLNVGPQRVATAIVTHWPNCQLQTLTLYRNANDLRWCAFCTTSEGLVAGAMDNRTALFQPEGVSPAQLSSNEPPCHEVRLSPQYAVATDVPPNPRIQRLSLGRDQHGPMFGSRIRLDTRTGLVVQCARLPASPARPRYRWVHVGTVSWE